MQNLPILVMGFTSILLQITVLRKMLSVLAGNELIIGMTLAIWLIAVSAGSFLGRSFTSLTAFCGSFLIVALLAQPTMILIDRIPFLFSVVPGETMPLDKTLAAAFLCLFPLGLALGSQFPMSVSALHVDAPRAYGLEAAGAFAAGISFTYLISGKVNSAALATLLSSLNIVIAVALFKKKLLILLAIVPLAVYFGASMTNTGIYDKTMHVVKKTESRYGEIMVLRDRDQANVYAAGTFQYSYPDRQSEEMKVHLPLSLHESPSNILVIGGSPAVLREMLKHPVSSAVFAEIDPGMRAVSLDLLSDEDLDTIKDPRVTMITADARRYIKSIPSPKYDLVLLNLPEPSTAAVNRFYTVEFFREARAVLKQNGILCLTLPVSSGYIGRRLQIASGCVYASLKKVFSRVEVTSEEYGGMFASDGVIEIRPDVLARRLASRRIHARHFYPLLFKDIFDPFKTEIVKARLGSTSGVNTDIRPLAYLYILMVWADTHGGKFLNYFLEMRKESMFALLITLLLLLAAAMWRKKSAVGYAVFTAGYSGMALSVAILLAFQAAFGYVYEMIGMITAMFMAGLALGVSLANRIAKALVWLRILDGAMILLLAGAPLFFGREYFYYMLSLVAGIIGGMQFSAASRYAAANGNGFSGTIYAIDLAGSVFGALLTALFFVPLLGIGQALLALMVLKASSLVLLFSLSGKINVHDSNPSPSQSPP